MKKVLFLLGALAGVGYGACMGPFCWDDRGAYVNGLIKDGNGDTKPSIAKASIAATAPTVAGQVIYCSDCTRSSVCVSSGTGKGAYVVAVETGTMPTPTHCQ